jgi:translation initiation factor 1
MARKKTPPSGGIVYSTDPDFGRQHSAPQSEGLPAAAEQPIRILLDSRQRAGKSVTLLQGFQGSEEELSELGKKLKSFCGTGGSVKDGLIIIQGDQRAKVLRWLIDNGYTRSRQV